MKCALVKNFVFFYRGHTTLFVYNFILDVKSSSIERSAIIRQAAQESHCYHLHFVLLYGAMLTSLGNISTRWPPSRRNAVRFFNTNIFFKVLKSTWSSWGLVEIDNIHHPLNLFKLSQFNEWNSLFDWRFLSAFCAPWPLADTYFPFKNRMRQKFIFHFCAGGRCLHLVWMAAASPFSLSDRCAWCCDGQVRNLYPTRFSLSLFRFFSAGLIRDSHRLRHTPQDWLIKSITFHLLPLHLLFSHFFTF